MVRFLVSFLSFLIQDTEYTGFKLNEIKNDHVISTIVILLEFITYNFPRVRVVAKYQFDKTPK
jgi:hypothetical protein